MAKLTPEQETAVLDRARQAWEWTEEHRKREVARLAETAKKVARLAFLQVFGFDAPAEFDRDGYVEIGGARIRMQATGKYDPDGGLITYLEVVSVVCRTCGDRLQIGTVCTDLAGLWATMDRVCVPCQNKQARGWSIEPGG